MKKKSSFIFLIILSFSAVLQAQWFEEETTWTYKWGEWSKRGYETVTVGSDTLVNGISCKQLNRLLVYTDQAIVDSDTVYENRTPWIVYEENDQVFYWSGENFQLMYDFNLEIGEELIIEGNSLPLSSENCTEIIDEDDINYFTLYEVDTIMIQGEMRRVQYFHTDGATINWYLSHDIQIIEGLGFVEKAYDNNWTTERAYLIMDSSYPCYLDGEGWIFCEYQDNSIYYKPNEQLDCTFLIPPPTVTAYEIDLNTVKLQPNPARDIVELIVPENFSLRSIKIQTPSGKIIQQINQPSNSIPLNFDYKGLILIQLDFEEGSITQKLIKL